MNPTTSEVLKIPRDLCVELAQLALDGHPDECCGMLSARDGVIVGVHPAQNVAPWKDRPVFYVMSPHDQMRIHEEVEAAGTELVAVYHSHPHHEPNPSLQDVNNAAEDLIYLIVGLKPEIILRAWRMLPDDAIYQVPIRMV